MDDHRKAVVGGKAGRDVSPGVGAVADGVHATMVLHVEASIGRTALLGDLQGAGLAERRVTEGRPPATSYTLIGRGEEAWPVLDAFCVVCGGEAGSS